MKTFKSFISVSLTLIMIFGLFAIVPLKSSAAGSYEKVTSAPSDWTGDYLIVYEGGNVAFNGGLETLNVSGNKIDVTINNNAIASNATTDAAKFTIAAVSGGYSIQNASGKYVGSNTNNSNTVVSSDSALINTIEWNNNSVKITSSAGSVLRYNTSASCFRYYKSGSYSSQQPIQLYKLNSSGGDTPEPTTAAPTTAEPTTAAPTTAEPTTAVPTTVAPTTAAPSTNGAWYKASASDVHNGDTVIVTMTDGFSYYGLDNDNGTGSAPSAINLTVDSSNDTLNDTNEKIANCSWIVGRDGDNFTFSIPSDNDQKLYCTNTNNGVRVGDDTKNTFVIDNDSGYLKNTSVNRYVGVYNSQDWRCYTGTDGNISGQELRFWKYVDSSGATDPATAAPTTPEPTTAPSPLGEKTDVINREFTGVESGSTSYTDWTGTGASGAVYAGNSAGQHDAVQLRTTNSNSGIVTTTSGGKVKKITVTWNSNTQNSKKLLVYGKDTPYSSAEDLYSTNASTKGTSLGEIVYGTTELEISETYKYIGVRSNDGAMWIDEIQITWKDTFNNPTHTVTWNNWDGDTIKTDTVEEGESYSYSGVTPAKDSTAQYNYDFTGWKREGDDNLYTDSFPSITSDTTFTAQFEQSARTYTVTWKNGENTLETDTVGYDATPEYNGEAQTKEKDAQYTYTFDGWQSSIDNQVYTAAQLPNVKEDVTYTAHFAETLNTYTVYWLREDSSLIRADDNVAYGTTPAFGEDPTKAATDDYYYVFTGWTPEVTSVTGDAYYTATFQEKSKHETFDNIDCPFTERPDDVSYDSWSGKVGASSAVYAGNTSGENGTIKMRGSDNSGIVTTSSGGKVTNVKVIWNSATASGRTLQVYGKTSAYTSAANLYNEDNRGTLIGSIVYDGTQTMNLAVNGNYTFIGLRSASSAMYIDEIEITWAPSVSTVTWKNGNTVLEEDTDVAFGSYPSYDGETPTKAEDVYNTYTFDGWQSSADNQVYAAGSLPKISSDVTYTAHFAGTAKTYTVRWLDHDSTVLATQSYEAGQTPSYPNENPEAYYDDTYRYTFTGWTPAITDVTSDKDYTAEYSKTAINYYNVTWYNYDGTELDHRDYPEGQTPKYYGERPYKPDDANYRYVFSGWSPALDVLIGPNVTYTAQFTRVDKTSSILPMDTDVVSKMENSYYLYNGELLVLGETNGFSVDGDKLKLGDSVVADVEESDTQHLGDTVYVNGIGTSDKPYEFYPNYIYGKSTGDISGYHNNINISDYNPGDGFVGYSRINVGDSLVSFMAEPSVSQATFNGYVGVGMNNYGYNYVNENAVAYNGHGPYEFGYDGEVGYNNQYTLYYSGGNDSGAYVFTTVHPEYIARYYRRIPEKEPDIFEKGHIEYFLDDDDFIYSYSNGVFTKITEEETVTTELINRALTPSGFDAIFNYNNPLIPDFNNQYYGGRLLGFQKKLTNLGVEEENSDSLRFMTVLSSKVLKKLYNDDNADFGYVFAAVEGDYKNSINIEKLTVDKGNKYSCKNTTNTLSGSFGDKDFDSTEYKYITAGVDEIKEGYTLAVRFYITYKGETHYITYKADYPTGNKSGFAFYSSDYIEEPEP